MGRVMVCRMCEERDGFVGMATCRKSDDVRV